MKKYFVISGIITLGLISCKSKQAAEPAPKKIINNYATTTANIIKLEAGMMLSEVNQTLNCEPTDFYSNVDNNEKIVVYKYRKNYQAVPVKQKDQVKLS